MSFKFNPLIRVEIELSIAITDLESIIALQKKMRKTEKELKNKIIKLNEEIKEIRRDNQNDC